MDLRFLLGVPLLLSACAASAAEPMSLQLYSRHAGAVAKDEAARVAFTFTNAADAPRPFFRRGFGMSLRVLEHLEERPSAYILFGGGGWGRGSSGCLLSPGDFVVLQPLERYTVFAEDVRRVSGGLAKEGPEGVEFLAARYRLRATYAFDRAAYVGRCEKLCPRHDAPEMPWNRAPEGPVEAHLEFTLR